jgi:predicted CXXCH cytochrome family protein
MSKKLPSILCALVSMLAFTTRADSVVHSVHNLSISGPGTNKATVEIQVCVFCHTPHRSQGASPLWNHNSSSVTNYIVYSSPTLDAMGLTIPQPNGASRLCLSCHDGTVALGSVSSRTTPIAMQNGVTKIAGHANLGTDLSGDHPISFVYDQQLAIKDPTLKDPSTLKGKVRLDGEGRMQCTACHDPHDNQFGNFLSMDNTGSALCLSCHSPSSWPSSVHAIAPTASPQIAKAKLASPSHVKVLPKTTTVAAMGCESCHVNHRAGSKTQLMKFDLPEDNCLSCHSGSVAKQNIAKDIRKTSAHLGGFNAKAHNKTEDLVNPKARHVVCADCHNSHAATTTKAVAPYAPGGLNGVAGVTAAGGITKNIEMEYELCFRCHGDSVQKGGATVPRQINEHSMRLVFQPANQSFHPVVAAGRNPKVPSLIDPLKTSSVIYCTDCHNSDTGPRAGGTGADGPHGSRFAPLLERQLVTDDNVPESPANYSLCYKCHSRSAILSDQADSFRYHRLHIVDKQTACTTCHDSHGVANARALVNFNKLYVSPNKGVVSFNDGGVSSRSCTLTCHGKAHDETMHY